MKMNESQQNYNAIDLAKFICSILVIAIHVSVFGASKEADTVFYINFVIKNWLARIAVPFFFVTSGYLLYLKMSAECISITRIKQYCIRILRLYIVWSIIYLPIVIKEFIGNGVNLFKDLLNYIQNFLFMGSCLHLWYLNAILIAVIMLYTNQCAL